MLKQKKIFISDLLIFITIFIIFCTGIITVYSATYDENINFSFLFIKQFFGFFSGILLFFIFSYIDHTTLISWGSFLHKLVLLLLSFTLFKGRIALGGQRWIDLGFIKFQPSELAKITLPLYISFYLMKYIFQKITFKEWTHLLLTSFLTFFLIAKQPDLGSGLIVLLSSLVMLYVLGIPRKYIIYGFFFICMVAPLLWTRLHNYQKKRILVFLGYGSVNKERYQLEQSKIAIGSGGVFGKGFLEGTQKNFKFLPESHTDLIFAVFAEEKGFVGVSILLFLYIFLILNLFFKLNLITNINAYALSLGLILSFILSVICNIGMVMGMLPVVGIPLPCMSYGVSNLWVTFISFGIINNIIFNFKE